MRLWHQSLIEKLPRQQLLGQHRECCALRGKGWGRKHSVVNYVFDHEPERLVAYHYLVMDEMIRRGYHPDTIWYEPNYRGKELDMEDGWAKFGLIESLLSKSEAGIHIYKEHNAEYYAECIENLRMKGIEI
jgi:uncharacterized protein (TIGR02328 family)